ncbi:SCO family protein [Croceimicrobium hydrocarbonivorans]|uniref:SCO family protein n=1 Tax=Croceimicrobium hydrocarbonivorans TaxID=2761580 RepID=A0A7H0VHX5_9FLAO|nr:SCO family protein [Croceimicrobium hydrocarbonivorans]QNR25323.1 SCO family protein [Croceimicrobium hydrocarbonivorans]
MAIFCLSLALVSCQTGEKEQVASISELPYYNEASFTPHWLEPNSTELKDFHKIPPFQLINQEGDSINEKTFEGKIYVADFFFTSCPGICPKMTTNMSLLQKAFLDDNEVLLLSHSVTPDYDSVSVLKDYAQAHQVISGKWHLVTGDRDLIYSLGRKGYFVEEDLGLVKSSDDFLHTENFVLVDKQRRIRGIYNGLNLSSVNQLILDIESLKQEG